MGREGRSSVSATGWEGWRLMPEEIKGTEFEKMYRAWRFAIFIGHEEAAEIVRDRMLRIWAMETYT